MKTIATIGYEDFPPAAFIALLRREAIETVADVRAIANSRKPGYAKRALSAALADADIRYWHMPELGTPGAGRQAARQGDAAALHAIYRDHLRTPEAQAALVQLAAHASVKKTCLLCLEADLRHCHRTDIAEALRDQFGFSIQHLHGGGGWAPLPKKWVRSSAILK
jgi:uncharacterized protein (DUF488 family)